jgi:hypothetical protein
MRTLWRALAVVVVAGCSGQPFRIDNPDAAMSDPHGGDAGQQTTGCGVDSDCGDGEVCVNCDGDGQCTPGCRQDSDCGDPRDICQLGTVCQSCPCPPGWCILNPCRDDDSDGYAATSDPTVTCTIPKGDCNDRDPTVHPGAVELCTNYVDDNCDGLTDEQDPSCQCPSGEQRCTDTWDCGSIGTVGCDKGCCTACSQTVKPDCSFNGSQYCAQPYSINSQDGCNYGWGCDDCGSCPTTVDPVCSIYGVTYDNACLLGLRVSQQMHTGACIPGEGILCKGYEGTDGGCGPSGQMYCRDTCGGSTSCLQGQCTKNGTCLLDSDCPAGLDLPLGPCDAGAPAYACNFGTCTSICR